MNKFIDELTMASYESEMDLDRDVPGDEAFLEFNNMVDEDEVDVITDYDLTTDHGDSFDDYLDEEFYDYQKTMMIED